MVRVGLKLAPATIGARPIWRAIRRSDFRYSPKNIGDKERDDKALKGIGGERLTYRRTAALPA